MTKRLLEYPECGRVRYQRDVEAAQACPECGGQEWAECRRTLDPDDPFDRP